MDRSPIRAWVDLIVVAVSIGLVVGVIVGTALLVTRAIGGLLD